MKILATRTPDTPRTRHDYATCWRCGITYSTRRNTTGTCRDCHDHITHNPTKEGTPA